MPSKAAFDEKEPCLGRIRADSVAPPHTVASLKRRISRVEQNPALANANLFADISSDVPLKEGHISILGADCPGLSPDEPMAIVQSPICIIQAESPIPDGRYVIKNRKADTFWNSTGKFKTLYFHHTAVEHAKGIIYLQVRSILQLFKRFVLG